MSGSSPLARGLRHQGGRSGASGRIIPARAGFTRRWRPSACCCQDHPRSRGVYQPEGEIVTSITGSSPLARGLLIAQKFCTFWAGDHPRSRGVYCSWWRGQSAWTGSSPLARGLQPHRRSLRELVRIIPARAGFTSTVRELLSLSADHPRSRGVYPVLTRPRRRTSGSSPLARGLPAQRQPVGRPRGIIPARAGFTTPSCSGVRPSADHPRSRGVYVDFGMLSEDDAGSSPLARGLP